MTTTNEMFDFAIEGTERSPMAVLTFGAYRLAVWSEGEQGFGVAIHDAAEIAALHPDDDYPASIVGFQLPLEPRAD